MIEPCRNGINIFRYEGEVSQFRYLINLLTEDHPARILYKDILIPFVSKFSEGVGTVSTYGVSIKSKSIISAHVIPCQDEQEAWTKSAPQRAIDIW